MDNTSEKASDAGQVAVEGKAVQEAMA